MSLPTEHKALAFVGAIAVLGAGVRVVRANAGPAPAMDQPALARQSERADSAANAGALAHAAAKARGRGGRARAPSDTGQRGRNGRSGDSAHIAVAPLDRKGWINGRLDLDVATAAQIDSLPGVTPTMAKRIVADRNARGPFLTLDALRRVSGVGPKFIQRIDSLVTFSGVIAQPDPNDTIIPRRRPPAKRRARTSPDSS